MAAGLFLFALSDWGTIVSLALALAALIISLVAALQVRRTRQSAGAAERAQVLAEEARRAATTAEEQVAVLREGLARQAARDHEQRAAAFPRLQIVGSEVGAANSVTIRHVGGTNPATLVHVVLRTSDERHEGDISLLPAGEAQACNLKRVEEPFTEYFPDLQSALAAPLRTVAQVIWTSTAGGRGRYAVRLEGGQYEEILHDEDFGVGGY